MMVIPRPCLVDTNVAIVANGKSEQADDDLEEKCIDAILDVCQGGLVLDSEDRIFEEYRRNLSLRGEPGVGDFFMKWVNDHRYDPNSCELRTITCLDEDEQEFAEFPDSEALQDFDKSDRKFVAVANAGSEKRPIIQAVDFKWWGWKKPLEDVGIHVVFLDETTAEAGYLQHLDMANAFFKFPSTPHLTWSGTGDLRGDKVWPRYEAEAFLSQEIVVEEKVDGANLGLSFAPSGELRFQNRGNWIDGKLTGQWERLRQWAAGVEGPLREVLPKECVLFGEWCYAKHSVVYDRLPDWFLGFDVWDFGAKRFWSTERRDALLRSAGLMPVLRIGQGRYSLEALLQMLNRPSAFTANGTVEGIYMRRENGEFLEQRCKIIRPTFSQAIEEHWSSRPLEPNKLGSAPNSNRG